MNLSEFFERWDNLHNGEPPESIMMNKETLDKFKSFVDNSDNPLSLYRDIIKFQVCDYLKAGEMIFVPKGYFDEMNRKMLFGDSDIETPRGIINYKR